MDVSALVDDDRDRWLSWESTLQACGAIWGAHGFDMPYQAKAHTSKKMLPAFAKVK